MNDSKIKGDYKSYTSAFKKFCDNLKISNYKDITIKNIKFNENKNEYSVSLDLIEKDIKIPIPNGFKLKVIKLGKGKEASPCFATSRDSFYQQRIYFKLKKTESDDGTPEEPIQFAFLDLSSKDDNIKVYLKTSYKMKLH